MTPVVLLFGSPMVFGRLHDLKRSWYDQGFGVVEVVDAATATDLSPHRWAAPLEDDPSEAAKHLQRLVRASGLDVAAGMALGEQSVVGAAATLDRLGLAGPGRRAALISRDKGAQRARLGFTPDAWVHLAPDEREAGLRTYPELWPAIVKPTSRHSSSGVMRAHSRAAARQLIESHLPGEDLLIESEAMGQELSVEALVHDGAVRWRGLTMKTTTSGDAFVETGHTVGPGHLSEQQVQAVHGATYAVVERLGVGTALLHAEFRFTSSRLVLMEVATRPAGDAVLPLHSMSTHQSVEDRWVKMLCGVPLDPDPIDPDHASQVYLPSPPGAVTLIRTTTAGAPVHDVRPGQKWPSPPLDPVPDRGENVWILRHAADGSPTKQWQSSGDRACSIVSRAPTLDELSAVELTGRQHVAVTA